VTDLQALHRGWNIASSSPPGAGGVKARLLEKTRGFIERRVWPRIEQQAEVNASTVRLVAGLLDSSRAADEAVSELAALVQQHKAVLRRLQMSLESLQPILEQNHSERLVERCLGSVGALDLLEEPYVSALAEKLAACSSVLIVGCKWELLLAHLQERGVPAQSIVGVGETTGPFDPEVIEADPHTYLAHSITEPVDGIVLRGFAHIRSPDDLITLLLYARAALASGGILAVDAFSPDTGSPGLGFLQDARALNAHRPEGLRWLLKAVGFDSVESVSEPSEEHPRYVIVGTRRR
jgi:hypothetical protein